MMENKEAELRKLAESFEFHRTQLEQLVRQEEMLRLSLEEVLRAKETLVRLKDSKDDSEILIPIGSNNFVFGKLSNREKVISGVGADVAIEGTIEEALGRLELTINELTEAKTKIGQKSAELNDKVMEISAKLQNAYESQKAKSSRKKQMPET